MQFAFFIFSLVKNGQPLRSGRFVHDNSLNETGNGRLLFCPIKSINPTELQSLSSSNLPAITLS